MLLECSHYPVSCRGRVHLLRWQDSMVYLACSGACLMLDNPISFRIAVSTQVLHDEFAISVALFEVVFEISNMSPELVLSRCVL